MNRKLLVGLLMGVVLVLGFALAMPTAAQDRWDGADDLPVNPLECPVAEGAAAADAPAAGDMPEYDGGQPTDAPDLAGQPIVLVDVPKLVGIGYFAATTLGQQQAAEELGNVTVTTDAPTEANIDDQIAVIDNYITQGVNGILFAANDPVAIAPVLTRALEAGIHVVGYDANSEPSAREWFVNQAEFNGIAKAMIDSMVAEIGADGSFAIVTSTFTTPNQARWIAEMQAYQGKCYPELTWLETVEAQEDNVLSFNQATTLINKYGPDLDGIFGMTSVATPAAADAVAQAGLCAVDAVDGAAGSEEDAVAVVGLATPNAMKPYVTGDFAGCVKSVVLWNPIDLGYAAVYVLRAVVDGEFAPGDTSVMAGRLGELQVVNGSEVLLGPPSGWRASRPDLFYAGIYAGIMEGTAMAGTAPQELISMTRQLGQPHQNLVIIGEGNTSNRVDTHTFWIKASGRGMQEIGEGGFVEIHFEGILDLLDSDLSGAALQEAMMAARVDSNGPRPSVEVTFHAMLLHGCDVNYVGHTHPLAVNQLLCSTRAEQFARNRLFPDEVVLCGPESVFVPYVDPGLPLAQAMRAQVKRYMDEYGEAPKVILMQNHGLIVLGQSPTEILNVTAMCVKAAGIFAGACAVGGPVFMSKADVMHIYRRPDEIYRRKLFVG